jgi:hypothetical protein
MSDDRSERLRQRRKQSQERARDGSDDEPVDPSERDEQSKQSKSSAMTEPDEGADTVAVTDDSSVKDEQVGTYMYLPQSQKKELERLYNVLKAEYEYEYDDQFEKNRAFYPLVVKHGFESLDSMDISEVRESLERI